MIIVGANVSSAGGVLQALPRAMELGVQAIQFFASSPRSWRRRVIDPTTAQTFRNGFEKAGMQLWIHGSYLMNFATTNPASLAQSRASLEADLADCAALGGKGVIFHLGSHKGRGLAEVIEQIVFTLSQFHLEGGKRKALQRRPWIVIENSAGMGGSIGSRFDELGTIVRQLPRDQVKICLDTQHAFAAGYPVHTHWGLDQTLADFDREIGLDRLVALHSNDSKIPLGGGVDRHANIGDGFIGHEGLRGIVQHPKLQGLPFLLEVPGVDHSGPDKDNVDRLRSLVKS